MPIQMFAIVTETRDQSGEVSQLTGSIPTAARMLLTTPESLLSIHDQVDADTMSGSSQGTRKRARRVAESRKFCRKNRASAMPAVNWAAIDTTVNTMVCHSAGPNVGSSTTVR